jgi:hypothetical protein
LFSSLQELARKRSTFGKRTTQTYDISVLVNTFIERKEPAIHTSTRRAISSQAISILSTDSSSLLKANKETLFIHGILTYHRKVIARYTHGMLIAVVVKTNKRKEPVVDERRRDKGPASIL